MAKVLVVDDDPDVVEACRLVLERAGHEVCSASSRSEGMAAIEKNMPDLLVLDVMMDQPDDGIAMAQQLRRGGFVAPILMLTSVGKVTGMDIDKDDAMVPVDAFFEKPVDPQDLIQQVKVLLTKQEAK